MIGLAAAPSVLPDFERGLDVIIGSPLATIGEGLETLPAPCQRLAYAAARHNADSQLGALRSSGP